MHGAEDERDDLLGIAIPEIAGSLRDMHKVRDRRERLARFSGHRAVAAAFLQQQAIANRIAPGKLEILTDDEVEGGD